MARIEQSGLQQGPGPLREGRVSLTSAQLLALRTTRATAIELAPACGGEQAHIVESVLVHHRAAASSPVAYSGGHLRVAYDGGSGTPTEIATATGAVAQAINYLSRVAVGSARALPGASLVLTVSAQLTAGNGGADVIVTYRTANLF